MGSIKGTHEYRARTKNKKYTSSSVNSSFRNVAVLFVPTLPLNTHTYIKTVFVLKVNRVEPTIHITISLLLTLGVEKMYGILKL